MVTGMLDEIFEAVKTVPDPEIPVLSLGDLGVVRSVEFQDGYPVITVSPTYSGCPATGVIEEMILEKLESLGFKNAIINRSISPPWSSEWISQEGRQKLRQYGIAPPNPQNKGHPESCPRCSQKTVSKISEFAATSCQAMWRCDECFEVFNYFKCI